MDPSESPPWQDLPELPLAHIADRLRCLTDRVHMSLVCPSWRQAETGTPRPRQLPWFLLPYRGTMVLPPNTARTAAFYCFLCRATHYLRVRNDTGGARFFGSYEGGWLFLAHGQTLGHALVNIHTGRRIRLPDTISGVVDGLGRRPRSLVILAATLSSPPEPNRQCIAAAIVSVYPNLTDSPRQIAFWRMERDLVAFAWTWGNTLCYLEDVIYHRGAFHFLTDLGNVLVCIPEFQEEAGLVRVRSEVLCFGIIVPYLFEDNLHSTSRYLVKSRGKLLMVVRYVDHPGMLTSEFRVFEMVQEPLPDGTFSYYWHLPERLYGRLLFVARGCSRSYEAAHFPGIAANVYFLDDRTSFDVYMMYQGRWYRRYSCSGNGRWRWERPPRGLFYGRYPSNYSPPIWLLP